MLNIKNINEKEVVFIDENNNKYKSICNNDQTFNIDIVEDIIDWEYRSRKKEGKNID